MRILKMKWLIAVPLLLAGTFLTLRPAAAQSSQRITLEDALRLGLQNSKTLKLSQAKIDEAEARYKQAADQQLPTIKASAMGSGAYIPTHKIQIKGLMEEPVYLPRTTVMYIGTFAVEKAIFAGHKLRYAKTSADLLKKIAGLNADRDKDDILFNIVSAYINLYKIDQNLKIIAQNLDDVQGRLEETQNFEEQGLATLNDVLRFKLEKSNVELTRIELENNRKVANYALAILLGLPDDSTKIEVDSIQADPHDVQPLDAYLQEALRSRKDLATYNYQNQLTDISIRNINADKLPTLGVGANVYYVNPNSQFIPPANSFLIPMTLGLNLSWNISSLYTSKHKVAEQEVKKREVEIGKSAASDQIRIDVNRDYRAYQQTLDKIKVLQTAVEQAAENDRIMESKYRNQLATTTDRIDAQTLLYQSKVNLALARADAEIAYYNLLKSTGTIAATGAAAQP
ncbi:TolC family protein [Compostibacter hankyongensis]